MCQYLHHFTQTAEMSFKIILYKKIFALHLGVVIEYIHEKIKRF